MREKKAEKIEVKYPRINVRLPKEMVDHLKAASEELGMSMSKLVVRCVRASIDQILKDVAVTRLHNAPKYTEAKPARPYDEIKTPRSKVSKLSPN